MKAITGVKLSIMMLLQYFIWGSWYVTMGTYMGTHLQSSGIQIGAAYSALAIATMISPFFIGMIADRYFSAERIMGFLHLIGGALLYAATVIHDNTTFYWVILLYSLVYMPTIALSNSIAFTQMNEPGKQFPWIRVFGTLGWIASGITIGMMGIEQSANTFYVASLASVALGVFSFILPNTPAKGKASEASKVFGTEAFVLFKDRSFLVFFVAAILVCIPLSFYYGFANPFLNEKGISNAASKMTMGQMSEAIFILAIPFLFYRIGVKKMLIMGILGWILRYVFFAFGDNPLIVAPLKADVLLGSLASISMLYGGILLHGICYDFFFVTGYMFTEKQAGEKIKNAAQGLFTFATYGVGMFIGTLVSGFVVDYYKQGDLHNWQQIWYVPAVIATVVLGYFVVFFKEKS